MNDASRVDIGKSISLVLIDSTTLGLYPAREFHFEDPNALKALSTALLKIFNPPISQILLDNEKKSDIIERMAEEIADITGLTINTVRTDYGLDPSEDA